MGWRGFPYPLVTVYLSMRSLLLLASALTVLLSCTGPSSQKNTVSVATEKAPVKTWALNAVHDSVVVNGRIDTQLSAKIVTVPISVRGTLTGVLTTDPETANLRFNRIIAPNGTTDGPFGRSINIEITDAGVYQIEIRSSQMASDAYTGPFRVALYMQ